MSFLELARRRASVRGYLADPVDEAELNALLEAARIAPTAANRQPFQVIVVRDGAQRRAVHGAYPRDWLAQAPVILVVCVDPAGAWHRSDGKSYADVDGAIVMDHITLCAADLGLGTCWIGAFDPAKLRAALGLPDAIEPLAMTPLGRPNDAGRPKKRKDLADLVRRDRW